jgi:hypothetical protein
LTVLLTGDISFVQRGCIRVVDDLRDLVALQFRNCQK